MEVSYCHRHIIYNRFSVLRVKVFSRWILARLCQITFPFGLARDDGTYNDYDYGRTVIESIYTTDIQSSVCCMKKVSPGPVATTKYKSFGVNRPARTRRQCGEFTGVYSGRKVMPHTSSVTFTRNQSDRIKINVHARNEIGLRVRTRILNRKPSTRLR